MLKEGLDYYRDEQDLMVLTEAYLTKRGYCCKSNCKHCPFGYADKFDPEIPLELQLGGDEYGEEY